METALFGFCWYYFMGARAGHGLGGHFTSFFPSCFKLFCFALSLLCLFGDGQGIYLRSEQGTVAPSQRVRWPG